MSPRHWHGEWKGPGPWQMQPGGEAWRGFGRRIFVGLIFMFAFFAFALWLLARRKVSISACQLQKETGIGSYKSA